MKKFGTVFIIFLAIFFLNIYLGYSEDKPDSKKAQTKSADLNNDKSPDVTYYREGKYAVKVEADTNYDKKPDVIVRTKEGKFESAEVDTDHNGKMDKKFTSESEFNKWINEKRPDFKDELNQKDWQFDLLKF